MHAWRKRWREMKNNREEIPLPHDSQFNYQRSKSDANNHNIW